MRIERVTSTEEPFLLCPCLPSHDAFDPRAASYFYGNRLVITGTKVGGFRCPDQGTFGKTVVHDNEYFTADGNITECGMSLQAWQAKGNDKGSTVAKYPKDAEIIGWAKAKLGF